MNSALSSTAVFRNYVLTLNRIEYAHGKSIYFLKSMVALWAVT